MVASGWVVVGVDAREGTRSDGSGRGRWRDVAKDQGRRKGTRRGRGETDNSTSTRRADALRASIRTAAMRLVASFMVRDWDV